jgi:glycosyltransferase involved in cell wall biosynthesis
MNRGGVETWLLGLMKRVPRDDVAIDLLVHTHEHSAYDGDVEALGATIRRNARTRRPVRYGWRLHRILGESRYDIVHSHVHHYSGVVLAAARAARVPVRIAHSHNDTRSVDRLSTRWRQTYLHAAKRLIRACATDGFACSDEAGRALFGERWAVDGRWHRLQYGIDTGPFVGPFDRAAVRAELSLPSDALVMVHVGRFEPQKNHAFLVDILAATLRRREDVFLMLIGSGPLETQVIQRADALGVRNRLRFCGSRSDVPRLLAAADVFVFPSHYEGLSLACLEAQAAGLRVVMTDSLTRELAIVASRVSRLPLGDADVWATAVLDQRQSDAMRRSGRPVLDGTAFDISVSAKTLLDSYRQALARERHGRGMLDVSPRALSAGARSHASD